MDKAEVKDLIRYIKGAYPRFEINDMTLSVWANAFVDEDSESVYAKLKKHIVNSKFEPSISELTREEPKKQEKKEREVGLYIRPTS